MLLIRSRSGSKTRLGGGSYEVHPTRSYVRGYHFCRKFARGVERVRARKTEEEGRAGIPIPIDGQHPRSSPRSCRRRVSARRLRGIQNLRPETARHSQSERSRPAAPPRAVSKTVSVL